MIKTNIMVNGHQKTSEDFTKEFTDIAELEAYGKAHPQYRIKIIHNMP